MKRCIKAAAALIFIVMACTFGGMNAFAWNASDDVIWVNYSDAPEGTAFADLLLKKTDDDIYLKETAGTDVETGYPETSEGEKKRIISLGGDCELAGDDDGYTSCLLRRSFVSQCISEDGRTKIVLDRNITDVNGVFNYYRSFKVAYCDEKGNVLLVTEAAEAEKTDGAVHYDISANGDKLECTVHHALNVLLGLSMLAAYAAAALIAGAVAIAGIIVLIVLIVRHRKKKSRS